MNLANFLETYSNCDQSTRSSDHRKDNINTKVADDTDQKGETVGFNGILYWIIFTFFNLNLSYHCKKGKCIDELSREKGTSKDVAESNGIWVEYMKYRKKN